MTTNNPHTVTFEWMDRRGRWHRESMVRGYADSRIAGLQDMNRPIRMVPARPVRSFDMVGQFAEMYWQDTQRRDLAAWANEIAWEDAGRLDDLQADLEAQD